MWGLPERENPSVTVETTMTRCSNHLTSRAAILAIAVFLAGSVPANADPAVSPNSEDAANKEEFVNRLFAGPVAKQKSYVCFVRQYDPEHLARHPLQKVSAMKLLLTAETAPESDGPDYSFRLGVRYRSKAGVFDSSGACSVAGMTAGGDNEVRLSCNVDCDGGDINVGLAKDSKATLIRLERIRIWRNNKPDEDASDELVAGADDKIFRLDRADLEECRSLVTDRKELAEMRRNR
jgi:hypothetical protein